ncbi:MAG: hypothetical protein CYPHOPRED_003377 [Cyphobasidiales sp. Tagirdzhanova-0007]|nr:MAG: hypothetical protein CYPHOPRED_003377 [Cyphobasidiales sp. Tagirdzhanova-0007]
MPGIAKYPQLLPEREFIGYGLNKPDPKWPNGAKIAVSFIVNYWYGSEANPELGDKTHEILHLDLPPGATGPIRNDMNEAQYEYGGREGLPRLLTLFKKYKVPATYNISVQALEIAPYWVQPIMENGGEISCASYRYLDYLHVAPEIEDEHINKSIDSLQKLTGDKSLPKGWFVDRRSNDSQRLYARAHEERGLTLVYSSDSASDELPFWLPSPLKDEGKADPGLLIVPMTHDTSDVKFNVDTFDVLLREGQEGEPKMMTVILHPHIIGHPGRMYFLEKLINYIQEKPDAWIATREDIAKHFASQFPYDPKTAFGQTKQVPCA